MNYAVSKYFIGKLVVKIVTIVKNVLIGKKTEKNCFNCEISKSCQDCLSKVTRIAEASVEINELKRQPENEFGFMLPYYEAEGNVIIEKPVQKPMKRYSKCETERNPDNYIKNKTIR